jgi:phosphate uptake regulator
MESNFMEWVTSTELRDELRNICKKVAATKLPVGIVRSGEKMAMIVATDQYIGNLSDLPEVATDFAKSNVSFLCLSALQGRDLIIGSSKFRVVVTRASDFKDEVVDSCMAKWRAAEKAHRADDLGPMMAEFKVMMSDLSNVLRSTGSAVTQSGNDLERRISELEAELKVLKNRKKPGPKPKEAGGAVAVAGGAL